jgi:hypothetical protein
MLSTTQPYTALTPTLAGHLAGPLSALRDGRSASKLRATS